MGPKNKTINSHPQRGPMGQPESAGAFQGPLFGEIPTWINGRTKPKINTAHAPVALMEGLPYLYYFRPFQGHHIMEYRGH
jgi:hypothetical protein